MAPSPAIRVGLIGCGNIGAHGHAPAYGRIAEATLVAACDVLPEHCKAIAGEYEIEAYTDYRRLLERDDIDMALRSISAAPNGSGCRFQPVLGIGTLKWEAG